MSKKEQWQKNLHGVFQHIDHNGGGDISYLEFLRWCQSCAESTGGLSDECLGRPTSRPLTGKCGSKYYSVGNCREVQVTFQYLAKLYTNCYLRHWHCVSVVHP